MYNFRCVKCSCNNRVTSFLVVVSLLGSCLDPQGERCLLDNLSPGSSHLQHSLLHLPFLLFHIPLSQPNCLPSCSTIFFSVSFTTFISLAPPSIKSGSVAICHCTFCCTTLAPCPCDAPLPHTRAWASNRFSQSINFTQHVTYISIHPSTCLISVSSVLHFHSTTTLHHHTPSPHSITTLHHHTPSPHSITTLHHHTPSPHSITTLHHHTPSPHSITTLHRHTPPPHSTTDMQHR